MKTEFIKLNKEWNAEPNAPSPTVKIIGSDIEVAFGMNYILYKQYNEESVGHLLFKNCWRYRLGSTNDEGWYRGQCRFSKAAPAWGEFYEVRGDLKLNECPNDWVMLGASRPTSKHFLFYFRDGTFECDADEWTFAVT